MTALAQKFKERYFRTEDHPYRIFEDLVARSLVPHGALLDAGCGRGAPVLKKFRNHARRLVGVDVVEFDRDIEGIELHQTDLGTLPLEDASIDIVMARSVMEHVVQPEQVYAEIARVLRPGGRFVFLTANLWDYATIVARLVPNRLHPWIVAKTEGREEQDVFPTAYKTNCYGDVRRLADGAGFDIVSFQYLGQYPGYFMFNGFLFFLATGYEKLISNFDCLRYLRGWILVELRKRAG